MCGHLNVIVDYLTPKQCSLMCCSNRLHSSGFSLSTRCWTEGICSHSDIRSVSEVQHWYWVIWSPAQFMFQFSSSQRCWMGLRSGLYADQSSSSTPNWEKPFLYGAALCTWALSCWNKKRQNTKCCHKVESALLSKTSLYTVALSFAFFGTKGGKPKAHSCVWIHSVC